MFNGLAELLELGVEFVAALGEGVFVASGLGVSIGRNVALCIVGSSNGLRYWRSRFSESSKLFGHNGFLVSELLLLFFEAGDALFILGFELLSRGELRGGFGQDGAVERAPDAHVRHFVRRR